jgi:hypothetical protein
VGYPGHAVAVATAAADRRLCVFDLIHARQNRPLTGRSDRVAAARSSLSVFPATNHKVRIRQRLSASLRAALAPTVSADCVRHSSQSEGGSSPVCMRVAALAMTLRG